MNIIAKTSGIRLGNGIIRQHRNAKIRRKFFAATALTEFILATSNARKKDGLGTIILGGLTCLMLKWSKDNHCIVKQLTPQRNAVILRAKKIFKSKP